MITIDRLPANMQDKVQLAPCPVPDLPGPCWIWTGAVTGKGYGSVGYQGRTWSSHKLAYTTLVGDVPAGLTLDHLCRIQLCCNAGHLEPVTPQINMQRAYRARFLPDITPRATDGPGLAEIFDHYFTQAAS